MVKKKVSYKKTETQDSDLYIVAVGASAGGLEALQEFLSHLPDRLSNFSILIAQHLSPTHKSMLVQLLSRGTELEVAEAAHGTLLEAGKVYITPPGKEISVIKGKIQLAKPSSDIGPKPSVNVLFQSLANQSAEHVIGIILSGTGTDGAAGVKALKHAGGFVIVQEPHTAKYDGMPLAAIQTEDVDSVLSPENMGEEILEYINHPNQVRIQKDLEKNEGNSLEKIFKLLSKRTGTDFSGYKSATIGRRLQKRMTMLKISTIEEYLAYVEESPKELDEMFGTILIGVTRFFRDEDAFGALEENLNKIVENKTSQDPIRIWVPGCSTGEEAYSIAILLSRFLKDRTPNYNIQIFATDIDEKALSICRKGVYGKEALENVSKESLEKYFLKTGNGFEVIKPIKQMVLFSKHDLTNNPPFLKLDLITCRNLLIYFGTRLQQQIIPIFHYALNPDGILFLGNSETVGQFSDLFSTVDGKNKLFKRKRARNVNPIKFSAFKAQGFFIPEQKSKKREKRTLSVSELVKETLFNTYEHPYVVIDDEYNIRETYGDVRLFLTHPTGSVHMNLLKMVNPELQIEVRSVVSKAVKNRELVKSRIRKFELYDKEYYVRITAKPLIYVKNTKELFVVIFEQLDIRGFVSRGVTDGESGIVDARVQELEHELAATKEHLQTYVEEIETSNEELQSLNEELQSTNEEFQSANEELETTNEELQSTNEEVQIAYSELKSTHDELEEKEELLQKKEQNQKALLDNKLQALFLIDQSYQVIASNELAEQYAEELSGHKLKTGDSVVDLTSARNLQGLVEEIKKAFTGQQVTGERKEKDSKGNKRWFSYNITPVVNSSGDVEVISVGMIDITEQKEFSFKLNSTERLLHSVFDAAASGICITDESGRFVDVNTEYCRIFGYEKEELIGKNFTMLVPPETREEMQKLLDNFIKGNEEQDAEWTVLKKNGSLISIYASARLLEYDDGSRFMVTSVKDLSENKKYRDLLQETQSTAKVGGWELDIITHELSWTEEIYNIFEVSSDTEIDLGVMYSHFLQEAGAALKESVEKAIETGDPFDIELVCETSAGEKKWIRITSKPIRIHNKTVKIFGTIQDITEKVETDDTQVAEQKKYRALFENTVAALLIGKPDGSILEANSAACKMFGYTNEEIREIGRQGLIDPDTPGLKEKLKERSAKGSTKGELIGIRKNGERFWCDFSSSVFEGPGGDTLSSVMMVDISEEIEAQKQLEESNERYEYVTQATSDAIWDFMPDTGKLFWGEGFKNLFGYERYGVNTGIEKWMDNIHPDDIERIEAGVSELLAGSQSNWDQEYRFKKADGSYTFVRDKAIVVRDDSGHTVRLIGAMEDISDRKFREHQKAIAANISHVFNNAGTLYEALDESIKQIAKLKSFAMAEFWLVDRDKDVIRLISHYVLTDEMDGFYNVAGSENIFKKNTGLPGKTWAKEKPLFWRNLHKRKSFIRNEAAKTGGLKTAFSFPVKDTNGVMGVLILGLDTDIKKERYDVPLFKELANQLASEINRKQLEEELFRIFSSAPDVICVAGLDGYYKKVNPAMSELLGYSEKELLNTPIIDFVHPLDKQKTEDEFEALNRGEGNYYFENRHITKSGQVIWLSWTTKPFYNEGITYSVAKDVTEQKELEDLLEQANRLARIGSWEVDLIKNEVYWSDITRQIHEEEPGYELTLDDGISYYKEGEPRERIEQAVEEAMKQGTPWDLELPIITAKGNERWIRTIGEAEIVNGKPVRIYGSFQDIDKRKKAEIAVVEASKERIELLDSIDDNFYALDKDYKFIFLNQSAIKLLGERADDLIGQSVFAIFPELKETLLFEKFKEVKKTQLPAKFEFYYDGSQKWYDESIYSNKEGFSVFFKNITEKKSIQLNLLEKTRQLDTIAIFNSLLLKEDDWLTALSECLEKFGEVARADRVYFFENSYDPGSDRRSTSMKIEWVKEGIEPQLDNQVHQDLSFDDIRSFIDRLVETRQYNQIVSEIDDREFGDFLAEQDIQSILALPVFVENEFRGFIGFDDCTKERIWSDEEIIFIQTISLNLASAIENEDAEKALQKAFKEKNEILESIGDAFFAVDRNFTVTYWNQVAENILGMPKEEIVGHNLWDKYEDAKELDFYSEYQKAMREQVNVHFEEYYPGSKNWFDVNAYPSENGLSVFFRDITEEKEASDRLKELNLSLKEKAKELAASNAELEQFAFVASHDLQEPLRMITGFLAQLERKYDSVLDEKGRKYIHFATDGAKRMRQIILDLLEFSRVGRIETERETVDLSLVMEDVLSLNKKIIGEKKAEIKVGDLPAIQAAKGSMRQLFQNLLNNALKYHEKGNTPKVKINATELDDEWKFTVSDNGIGINNEYLEKIFNIFQRLHGKEEYAGTGMGLAMCKKIVENHGGKIWAESETGKGSTFHFTISKNQTGSEND